MPGAERGVGGRSELRLKTLTRKRFTVPRSGADKEVGPTDLDGLIDYVKQLPQPFSYSLKGRISQVAR